MPPLAGPWDTLEEERRLDACRPWTTVRRISHEQLRPIAWTRVDLHEREESMVRLRKRKWKNREISPQQN